MSAQSAANPRTVSSMKRRSARRRSSRLRIALASALALSLPALLLACGPKALPSPPYVGQPSKALTEIPYPPPPAHIEYIPAAPKDVEAVWIDGEWTWQGRRWAWKKGRWVKVPTNASYAPWTTVRDDAGVLYVAQGAWRDKFGVEVPEPPALLLARVPPVAIIDPSGEQIPASTIAEGTQPVFDASITATGTAVATDTGGSQQLPEGGGLDARLEDVVQLDVVIDDALSRPDVIPISPATEP
jgi:hypothetical protein